MTVEDTDSTEQFPFWIRLFNFFNLRDLSQLLRTDHFWAGVIVRVVTIFGFIMLLNVGGDINDMNELVYQGLLNLVSGVNPYGQPYVLHTFRGPYPQNYFNYTPFAILFHLPTLLWPGPQSVGSIDFMPAFFLLHTVFTFITYYRLWQHDHRIISKMIWVNPFFVFLDVITFMSLPIMLLTLALLNANDGLRSGFYATLLAATYQMGSVFLPFLLVYHWQKKQFYRPLLGMIPIIVVVLVFFIWNPLTFIQDLIIIQIGRPPVNWQDSLSSSPYYNRYYPMNFLFMGSLPSIAFNLAIYLGATPALAPQFAPLMILSVAIFGIVCLIYYIQHPRHALLIFLPGITLSLFIASTAEGLAHYWTLCIPLLFLFFRQRASFYPSGHPRALKGPSPTSNPDSTTQSRTEVKP
ncbi:MAG: hypothetical protein ACFE89_10280 [Candidatus Hodarchaeota archaeon]